MLDDRDWVEVNESNIGQFKQEFCDDVGHTGLCVEETVTQMGDLVAKVAGMVQGLTAEELVNQIGVERFDKHLREILAGKECNCKNELKKTR